MSEALIEKNNSEIYLSVGDYINNYNNGGLSIVSYINTGLLSEIENHILMGSNWITNSLNYLEMPNVVSIDGTIGPIVVSVNKISAPKLKYVNGNMFYPIDLIESLYLRDVETIQMFPSNKILFNELSTIDYSKLSYITEYVFYSLPNLEQVILSQLSYAGVGNFCNCPQLTDIYVPKIKNYFVLESLPKLENLDVGLEYIGSGSGWSSYKYYTYNYLKDLTSINILNLHDVSIVMSLAFKNIPKLSRLQLSNCLIITGNVFDEINYMDSLPSSLYLSIPKVSQIDIFHNIPFKKVILPAITVMTSSQNSSIFNMPEPGNMSSRWGYPYSIEFPNLSLMDINAIWGNLFKKIVDYLYREPYSCLYEVHDLTLDLQKCETITCESLYVRSGAMYTSTLCVSNVIINTPNLKNIASFAFNGFGFLTEINLQNVSVLNDGVFNSAYNYYNSGIKLKNVENIKTVKAMAFSYTKLNSDGMYFIIAIKNQEEKIECFFRNLLE